MQEEDERYAKAVGWLFARPSAGVFCSTSELQERFNRRRRLLTQWLTESSVKSAKIFHVAGTNGKGSTCHILDRCLRESVVKLHGRSHSVGMFISPHLHTPRERIRVDGQIISKNDLVRLSEETQMRLETEENKDVLEWMSFFDKFFLVALSYFGERQVGYIVLETGMGGRWDQTNLFDQPCAAIITSIGLDHQEILGPTLKDIASQKAGIMKPGVPVFTMATQKPEVLEVFREESELKGAVLHLMRVREGAKRVSLEGDYQAENATLALGALEHLFASEDEEGVQAMRIAVEALTRVKHMCRFEVFEFSVRGTQRTVVIDGGHNEDSLQLMFNHAKQRFPGRPLLTVFGIGNEPMKLIGCVQILMEATSWVIFVKSSHFKALPTCTLHNCVLGDLSPFKEKYGGKVIRLENKKVDEDPSVADGIEEALRMGDEVKDLVVIVCGSLFACADGRRGLTRYVNFPEDDYVHQADELAHLNYK